ncbi:MAG: hypothetical protein ABIO94_01905, partial [Opitutaceae bacterium]
MNLDQAIEFVVAKFELLIEHTAEPQAREQIRRMTSGLDALWSSPRLSMRQLRQMDGEMLEMFVQMGLSPQAETLVREQLVARFKTSRLRAPDAKVARRVLSRGEIANIEEYRQVKEYVSCVDHSEDIGEENYGILASLVDSYDGPDEEDEDEDAEPTPIAEGKPSRRRPPPPFDLTLELDEKLCPRETPLERRVEFVRAKFARVIEEARSPQVRENLQLMLKGGLEFALGPQTPPKNRAAALEQREHEAEFFAGYEVNGSQHRAIELELEKEFGFRRLGRSAQARLAHMLATGDALDGPNRMFIERFIFNYPHQTLFTREQLKRAKQLLKAPSPSLPYAPVKLTPRPKTPPDLTQLCVGAVFTIKHCDKPVRVIAYDEIEVFYDAFWGEEVGWGMELGSRRVIYYRVCTPLFLDGAEKLRVDEPSARFLAKHRPDLPLRFGRSTRLQWAETPLATRVEFEAHVRQTEPALLNGPDLLADRLVLIPRSRSGAMQRPV